MVGYWFGAASGPYLFRKEDTFFFKKKHLLTAKDFYDKHGGGAIVFARFLPIIRTFAPILAGVIKVEFKTFMFYNILGGAMWIATITSAGYFLGQFEIVKQNIDWIIFGFVIVTTGILANTYIRQQRRKKKNQVDES
jgi:membrane-associated protein